MTATPSLENVPSAKVSDLRGLVPVNNFNPEFFLGSYYELLRLLPNESILFGIGLEGTYKQPWTNVTWNITPRKNNAKESINLNKLATVIRGYPSKIPTTPVTSSNTANAIRDAQSLTQMIVNENLFIQGQVQKAAPKVEPKIRSASLNATTMVGVYNSHLGDFGWLIPEKYVILDAGYISTPATNADPTASSGPSGPSGPYDYVIVGTPNRHNLWLLARASTALSPSLQQQYLKTAQANAYPVNNLQRLYVVPQTGLVSGLVSGANVDGAVLIDQPLP